MTVPAVPPAVVFDPAILDDLFQGDRAVTAAVLRTFAASTEAGLSDIRAAIAHGDLAATSRLAHRIKGACGQSGAPAMGQAARLLEQAASSGDGVASAAAAQALTEQWQALRALLAARC